jgi:hypothetical protein
MKVKIAFTQEAVAEITYNEKKAITGIVLTPKFSRRTGQVTVGYGECISDQGDVLEQFSLSVSGATGKLSKNARTGDVKALVDLPEAERARAKDEEE